METSFLSLSDNIDCISCAQSLGADTVPVQFMGSAKCRGLSFPSYNDSCEPSSYRSNEMLPITLE